MASAWLMTPHLSFLIRFYGIYYPFNNGFSQVVRRTVIIFIWFLSFTIAIPWILFFDLVAISDGFSDSGENHTILVSVFFCDTLII